MRFTVGGEEYDLTTERVISTMRGVTSDPIQKHLVEIDGTTFPPKQVFATVTGRARTTFTTMEAQRVLRRLGFVCREADRHTLLTIEKPTAEELEQMELPTPRRRSARRDDGAAWAPVGDNQQFGEGIVARLAAAEATIAALEAAVGGLHTRVKALEAAR